MFEDIVREGIAIGATDIHLQENRKACFRVNGEVTKSNLEKVGIEELEQIIQCKKADIRKEALDSSITSCHRDLRIHAYLSRNSLCVAIRILPQGPIDITKDGDADLLRPLCKKQEGLILICGPTGAGKTYTLGACISYINATRPCHIVTLEDPVEIHFENDKALIHQRELGKDISSMEQGVIEALREDPDVILIGEMRNKRTILAALQAAETGHLVFATVHTHSAAQAVSRLITGFSDYEQQEIRTLFADVLQAVICQRLFHKDGVYIPLRDIILRSSAVSHLIRQGKEYQLLSLQETDSQMRTFRQSLEKYRKAWEGKELWKEMVQVLDMR